MKQKEEWAKKFSDDCFNGEILDQTFADCWLAGFEFARKQCADQVCNCCDNQEFCRDLGEEDSEKDKAEKMASQIASGIRDKNGQIIPIPPTDVGVERLEDK